MITHGAVSAALEDLDLLKVTDNLDEAMHHLEAHTVTPFGLKRVKTQPKPKWWLFERQCCFHAGVAGENG